MRVVVAVAVASGCTSSITTDSALASAVLDNFTSCDVSTGKGEGEKRDNIDNYEQSGRRERNDVALKKRKSRGK